MVISDVHLGTYGCHARELLDYLKGIEPGLLVLNGDIIDIWQFKKRYWPKAHMKVIKHIMGLVANGVEVKYITGNHDEMLRKFTGFELGSLSIENKCVLELDGKKAWIFHGDVFDVTMQHSKWLAKLGSVGYDLLILLNRMVNAISERLGYGKISLSKKIKNSVKSAVKFINHFEQTVCELAEQQNYDYVICGHIHQPVITRQYSLDGSLTYLNSGDWIENLTALEYHKGEWTLFRYEEEVPMKSAKSAQREWEVEAELNTERIFQNLVAEFNLLKA